MKYFPSAIQQKKSAFPLLFPSVVNHRIWYCGGKAEIWECKLIWSLIIVIRVTVARLISRNCKLQGERLLKLPHHRGYNRREVRRGSNSETMYCVSASLSPLCPPPSLPHKHTAPDTLIKWFSWLQLCRERKICAFNCAHVSTECACVGVCA